MKYAQLINYTTRGYTTTADNYLNPIIKNFLIKFLIYFNKSHISYMQSSGFLATKK